MKMCSKCNLEKEDNEFYSSNICKACTLLEKKEYYQNNKEKIKENAKKWRTKNLYKDLLNKAKYKVLNKDLVLEREKKWKDNNLEKVRVRQKNWRTDNRNKLKEDKKKRSKSIYNGELGPIKQLKVKLHCLIGATLKRKGYTKRSRTHKLLGCDYQHLYFHLGPKPSPTHQIDHICPISQAVTEEEVEKLQHYTNLQWLSAEENNRKNDKYTEEGNLLCRLLLGRDWV